MRAWLLSALVGLAMPAASSAQRLALPPGESVMVPLRIDTCGDYRLTIKQLGSDAVVTMHTVDGERLVDNPLHDNRSEVLWFTACPDSVPEVSVSAKAGELRDGAVEPTLEIAQASSADAELFAGDLAFGAGDRLRASVHYQLAIEQFELAERSADAVFAAIAAASSLEATHRAKEAVDLLHAVGEVPSVHTLHGLFWHLYAARYASSAGFHEKSLLALNGLLESTALPSAPRVKASILNEMGLRKLTLNRVVEGRRDFQAVLDLGDVVEPTMRLRVLNNIGGSYFGEGRPADAKRIFQRSAKGYRELNYLAGEVDALGNLIAIDLFTGQFQRALSQALALLERQELRHVPRRVARANNLVGAAYLRLGGLRLANAYVAKALAARVALGNAQESLQSAAALAEVTALQGRLIEATFLGATSAVFARVQGDRRELARTLSLLLELPLADVMWPSIAWYFADEFNRLAQPQASEPIELARLRSELAIRSGNLTEAIDAVSDLGDRAERAVRPDLRILAGQLLADLVDNPLEQDAHLSAAYETSLRLWQTIASPQHLNRYGVRMTDLLASRLAICAEHKIGQCEVGLLEALLTMRRLSLQPFANVSSADSDLLERRERRVNRLRFARSRAAKPEVLDRLLVEIDAVDEQLQLDRGSIGAKVNLDAVQQQLSDGQLAIALVQRGSQLFRWRLTRTEVDFDRVNLGSEASLQRFVTAIKTRAPAEQIKAQGLVLGRQLLGPIDAGVKEVLLMPDGQLAAFPFAALSLPADDRAEWLVNARALRIVRDLTPVTTKIVPQRMVLVGGIPYQERAELPFSQQEIDAIDAIAGEAAVPTQTLSGNRATAEAVLRDLGREGVNVAHISAHGTLNPSHPELSEILLAPGQGSASALGFGDVLYGSQQMDLVVLSSCDSALGYPGATGAVNVGQALGTAAKADVVVSLWPIADASGPTFFSEFYAQLFRLADASAALRLAQLGQAKDRRFGHPYYWAGFQLVAASGS